MADPRPTYSGVIPHLFIKDGKAVEAIAFYKAAFAAEEVHRMAGEDGVRLMHAHLRINGGNIFLCDEFPEYGMSFRPMGGFTIHLQVDDCDAWFKRAVGAGEAQSSKEPEDMFWGDRYAQLRDAYGVDWSIGQAL